MLEAKHADTQHGLNLRAMLGVMLGLAATVALCAGVAFFVWHRAGPTPRQLAPNAAPNFATGGVPLEPSPREVRVAYFAEKDRLLHAHEWIDADAGVARIPIDVAMHALAERAAQRRAATPAETPRPSP